MHEKLFIPETLSHRCL